MGEDAKDFQGPYQADPMEKQEIPQMPSKRDSTCYPLPLVVMVKVLSAVATSRVWQETDKTLLQDVMRLNLPICNHIREDLLGGVAFPVLSASVMYGVLSKKLHQSDAGSDLYVGDDEGDAVIQFYQALAKRYGYSMTKLKRDEQVAYENLVKSGGC